MLVIETLVVHSPSQMEESLLFKLKTHCPELQVFNVQTEDRAIPLLTQNHVKLLFYEMDSEKRDSSDFLDQIAEAGIDTILLSMEEIDSNICQHSFVSGFVQEPISTTDLLITVKNVVDKMHLREMFSEASFSGTECVKDIIGIPTIEGFEYLHTGSIVRCEGLQKCTRVITTDRKDIISAYPIGVFRPLLADHGFYSIHRSHFINLNKVTRYTRDGFVWLSDGSQVPLARRKKIEFLSLWKQVAR